jgi:hypothetical protein
MRPGLNDDQLATWASFDELSRAMANYSDPPLRFEIANLVLSTGARIAVIEVFEFSDVPHLCARDYPDVLREGALYVRTRRLPETSEVASSVEMREVVDLATEKALRAYLGTADRAGGAVVLKGSDQPSLDDEELFDAQREDAWDV